MFFPLPEKKQSASEINFQESFFAWQTLNGSIGRFSIESICNVSNGNISKIFLLLAGVLACDVYGKKRLIHDPPYFFQALFGNEEFKVFREYFGKKKDKNTIKKISEVFTCVKRELCHSTSKQLNNFEEIAEAVLNNKNIVSEIKIQNSGHLIELLFPVKHINIERNSKLFQIETGWLAMPLPEKINNISADSFERGFIAFNSLKEFEFAWSAEHKTKSIVPKKFFGKHVSLAAEINLFSV